MILFLLGVCMFLLDLVRLTFQILCVLPRDLKSIYIDIRRVYQDPQQLECLLTTFPKLQHKTRGIGFLYVALKSIRTTLRPFPAILARCYALHQSSMRLFADRTIMTLFGLVSSENQPSEKTPIYFRLLQFEIILITIVLWHYFVM